MPPGGTSLVLPTGTNSSDKSASESTHPSPAPSPRKRREGVRGEAEDRRGANQASSKELVQREAEHLGRVTRGDLLQIGLRHAGEHPFEELLRSRKGRLGMRIVAAPQHVLDADAITQLNAEIVLHELDEHVALPVVARQQSLGRFPALG